MGLANLKRTNIYQQSIATADEDSHPELQRLRNIPFYIWNESEFDRLKRRSKGLYTFNELIGLPEKAGKRYPLFDYEEIIFRALEEKEFLCENSDPVTIERKANHLLVLKSAGLGLTTFFLRYLSWLCLKDDKLKGRDILILSGPREALSVDLITRLRQMFLPSFGTTFDTRETTLFLNGVRIRAFRLTTCQRLEA